MPPVEIKELLNFCRLPETARDLLSLFVYSPFGSILVTIRAILILVCYILSGILPKAPFVQHFLHRLLNIAFGIVVQVDNPEKKEDVETYVCNNVSPFDSSVVTLLTNSISPQFGFNPITTAVLGLKTFSPTNNPEELRRNVEDALGGSNVPLLFQPETAPTNGKALLKFNITPFVLYSKVQPITISIHRPVLRVAVATIASHYWIDLFWYMFVPCTIYRIKYLPAVEKKGISEEEFSDRIRQNIANDLNIEVTNYFANELKEFKKRYFREQLIANGEERPGSPTPNVNPELHQMTLQVREVLPNVPYIIIYKDLTKTKSVDVTITNILEGHIVYTSETSSESSPSRTSTPTSSGDTGKSSQSCPNTPFNTAAKSFGKSPHERTMSFQERKRQLIENARRKYIEKHGLNVVCP